MSTNEGDGRRGVAVLATANGSLIELDQRQLQLLHGGLLSLYDEMYVESVEAAEPAVTKHCRRQMKTIIRLVETLEHIETNRLE